MPNAELAARLFLQIAVILVACRAVGLAVRRLGQPPVVGEMLAGIILGPSLLGGFFPDLTAALFPPATKAPLYVLSQTGLALYMFLVGLEFQVDLVRARLHTALAVSLAGIAAPFTLGALVALSLTGGPQFVPPGVLPLHSALFLGACMSITAFPVLARIIQERGLRGSALGSLVLGAGAVDDVAAWSLLAIVVAGLSESPAGALVTVGGAAAYAAVMLTVGRPMFARLWSNTEVNGVTSAPFTTVLVILLLGAWFTESIGIHAVFGAFVFGLALPRGAFAREITARVEPLTGALLLPLFFTYSGLNTRVGLLDSAALWMTALAVLTPACLGKVAGCAVAARLSGESGRLALAIGALMNARGLMELIILNIGLERGLITPALFTIMVIMAVATTVMATPLFSFIYGPGSTPEERAAVWRT